LPGKLVFMPPPLNDERLAEQMDGKPASRSQPQIVIFTGRQGFVIGSDLIKENPVHHDRGGTDDTPLYGIFEYHA
jgi:hypothetical protein